jgi:hypothetical protein
MTAVVSDAHMEVFEDVERAGVVRYGRILIVVSVGKH